MVQEYLSAIDEEGELDAIFFGGQFSHAVLKKPALRVGEGTVERAWTRMAWAGLASPGARQLAVAEKAVAAISDRLGEMPAYSRIDLINGAAGDPLVLEAELIDPYLSLDIEPAAAVRLARMVIDP